MIIFDAHVHIYDCFDQSVLFDRAYVNFFQQASLLQKEPHFCGILLLAEKSDQKYFKRFQKKIGLEDRVEVGRWLITKTDEPNVLQAATLSGE
ncbi:MAG: hypothetical protein GY705_30730, partial [Bacteroidetes bacterium]|nr:hypothetical protein [Bacteroidota bacterium]